MTIDFSVSTSTLSIKKCWKVCYCVYEYLKL